MRPHDELPVRGLPEPLPADERLLWQGAPDWRTLACSAFHAKKLVVYFGIIFLLRATTILSGGGSVSAAMMAVLWLVPLAVAAIGMLVLMAWLTSRTTVYTITNKRVILHIGVVLDLTLNLPFDGIEQAGLKTANNGMGDIPIQLKAPNKIAYVHLWPHARPWRFARPEPMLRAIPDAAQVGSLLAHAVAEHVGDSVHYAQNLLQPGYTPAPISSPVASPIAATLPATKHPHQQPMVTAS